MIFNPKHIIKYAYRNILAPKVLSYKYRKVLSKNLELKDLHKGKKCFLVGSGPSIADIDLSRLKDEYSFVGSEFDKHPQFASLNPKYYIITDSAYFDEDGAEYWPERFKAKNNSISATTTILVNLGAKDFIEKKKMFKNHRFYYIGTNGIFSTYFDFNIDLDKFVPMPKNTILLCLLSAIYMGFEEIYLLGCEHNFLSHRIEPGKPIASFTHSYEDELSKLDTTNDEIVKKYLAKKDITMTYEDTAAQILQLFKNYRLLYGKVKKLKPNVKIYNTTPNSYLDVFPHKEFDTIHL